MDLLVQYAAQEWAFVKEAPVAALVLVLLVGSITFAAQEWRYGALRDRLEQAKEKARPSSSERPVTPNMPLAKVLMWIAASDWARGNRSVTSERAARELIDKLHLQRLTAFGRDKSKGGPVPIPHDFWNGLEIERTRGEALDRKTQEAQYFDLQFDMDRVEALWPRKVRRPGR